MGMLSEKIHHRGAWRSNTVGPVSSWYFKVSTAAANAAGETLRALRSRPKPVHEHRLADSPLQAVAHELAPLKSMLEEFPGFAVVRGLPDGSPQELTAMYWLLGQMLGRPVEQNVQGTILYDVRDTGQDVRYGARFSVTNSESSFHTDNSFGINIVDYIGLLCVNPSKSGGVNQVVSAYAAHNELLEKHPDILPVLYAPFHVDRRGGVADGENATIQFPVLAWDGRELTIRYLRYWIEVGHEKAGVPLNDRQRESLDILDRVLNLPELRAEFTLEARDILLVNNRWILHNRTAFEDFEQPDRKRHLVRLWVESNEPRMARN